MAPRSTTAHRQTRRAKNVADDKTADQILLAERVRTDAELQRFMLSRIREIIFGDGAAPSHRWFEKFSDLGILSLTELSEDAAPFLRHRPLDGTIDGVNDTYTIQGGDKAVLDPANGDPILFYVNGVGEDPDCDYQVLESGGVGTGYDTIKVLRPKKPLPGDRLTLSYRKQII